MQDEVFHRRELKNAIADSVCARIFEHEFKPGKRLDVSELANYYGVSQTSITEALRQLVRSMVLLIQGDNDYRVAEYDRADIEGILNALEVLNFQLSRQSTPDAAGKKENGKDQRKNNTDDASRKMDYSSGCGPFIVAAENLHDHLHICLGPALTSIERDCRNRFAESLKKANQAGNLKLVKDICSERAGAFRQAVLEAYDGRRKPAGNNASRVRAA